MEYCNYAMEGWEWESFLSSSFLEQETLQSAFHESEGGKEATSPHNASDSPFNPILASTPSSKSIPHAVVLTKPRDGNASSSTPALSSNVAIMPDGSFESGDHSQDASSSSQHLLSKSLPNDPIPTVATKKKKKKKRDPRLECPNFVAGRIPCSCPEEDELDEAAEARDVVKKRLKVAGRCQVPSCGRDINHLKDYHQRHRVCLGCAKSTQVLLKGQPHRYCQQCGKFHWISDFDEDKRSCRRKLEWHNRRRRQRQPSEEDEEAQDLGAHIFEIENENGIADSSTQAGLDLRNLVIDDRPANKDLPTNELRCRQGPFSCDQNDEQPWLTSFMDDFTHGVEIATVNFTDLYLPKQELPRAAHTPTSPRRDAEYTSPCPIGRVSFKLYDWNPADFPRRLRQQIFEWLANMPLELEGYIRSGCIIMTFFIAAPQATWDKIMDEWVGQIQTLLLWSGPKLWGTSQLLTPGCEKNVHVREGEVTHAEHYEKQLAPYVVDLHPCSLQAGCQCHIYVSGFNFDGARFLVSFGERYLECSDCGPANYHRTRLQRVWKVECNLEFRKVNVFLPDSQKVGPAYLEVENCYGVSNFMPLLVANKDVCEEINVFGSGCVPLPTICSNNRSMPGMLQCLKPHSAMNALMDLGWALRYTNKWAVINSAKVSDAFKERLQRLLTYCSEHGWRIAAQHLVQPLLSSSVVRNRSFNSGGQHYCDMIASLRVADDIDHFLSAFNSKLKLSDSSFHKAAILTKVDGSHTIDLSSQHKALSEFTSTDTKLRPLLVAAVFSDRVVATWAKEDGWKLKIGSWLQSCEWIRMQLNNSVRLALLSGNDRVHHTIVTAVCILAVCTEFASSCSIHTRLKISPWQ